MHLSPTTRRRLGARSSLVRASSLLVASGLLPGVLAGCSDDDTAGGGDPEGFCATAQPGDPDPFFARVEFALEHGLENPLTGDTVDEWVLEAGDEASEALVADAPEVIRGDVRTVLEAQDQAQQTGAVDDLDGVRAAADRVDAWAEDNCD